MSIMVKGPLQTADKSRPEVIEFVATPVVEPLAGGQLLLSFALFETGRGAVS